MAFGFVDVQHYSGLCGEGGVDVFEAVGDVFMYRRLGNPKPSGGLTHSGVVVDDVISDSNGPFFDIFLQNIPQNTFFTMYAGKI